MLSHLMQFLRMCEHCFPGTLSFVAASGSIGQQRYKTITNNRRRKGKGATIPTSGFNNDADL